MSETKLVYSGETGTLESTSLRFQKATGIYIQNRGNSLELEFDAYLNIYISNVETRKINITNLRELNILDTIDFIPIPIEYAFSGLDMSITIVSDISINIDVYVLIPDCLCKNELEDIQNQLDSIELKQNIQLAAQATQTVATLAIGANQLAQNASLVALASGLAVAFSPYTGGASLAIAPAVAAPLGLGSTALLGAGLLLP